MAVQIQLRRGTASEWTAIDPVLSQGELGLELDTSKIKIGTGLTSWGNLQYLSVEGTPALVPLATESITGLASFSVGDFSVSATGSVRLASNIVRTFNGLTGNVVYSPVVAGTGVTGVASFDSGNFSVSPAGQVTLKPDYVSSLNGITGAVTLAAGGTVTITPAGKTITISSSGGGGGGASVPLATSSITGVASFDANHFNIGPAPTAKVTLSKNMAQYGPSAIDNMGSYVTPPSVVSFPDLIQTGLLRTLAGMSSGATAISDQFARQVSSESTDQVLLFSGSENIDVLFNLGGGETANVVSSVYYPAADLTIFAYTDNGVSPASFCIRKVMVLKNTTSAGAQHLEYQNLCSGPEIGRFSVEATGTNEYWGLVCNPNISDKVYYNVSAVCYRKHQ